MSGEKMIKSSMQFQSIKVRNVNLNYVVYNHFGSYFTVEEEHTIPHKSKKKKDQIILIGLRLQSVTPSGNRTQASP